MGNEKKSSMDYDQVKKLRGSIKSYVEWSKVMERKVRADERFAQITRLLFLEDEDVLEEMELRPETAGNRDYNQSVRKKIDKWETANITFRGVLEEAMETSIVDQIHRHSDYANCISDNDPRTFWNIVLDVVKNQVNLSDEKERAYRHFNYIRVKPGETLDEYVERIRDGIKELTLIAQAPGKDQQRSVFFNGLPSHFKETIMLVKMNPEIDDMDLEQVYTAFKKVQSMRQTAFGFRHHDVVAGMRHKRSHGFRRGRESNPQGQDKKRNKNDHGDSTKRAKVVCFACQQPGHFKANCPNKSHVAAANSFTNTSGNPSSKTYLDTLATISLTDNPNQLHNITYDASRGFTNANGTFQPYLLQGEHKDFGRTAVLEGSPMNVASFGNMRQKFVPAFEDSNNRFTFHSRENGELTYVAPGISDGTYPLVKLTGPDVVCAMVSAQTSVLMLHRRLLHTNEQNLRRSLKLGHYSDVNRAIFTEDEWIKVQECTVCKMAKDGRIRDQTHGRDHVKRKVTFVQEDEVIQQLPPYNLATRIDVSLYFDLVFVGPDISVMMLVKPHNFLLSTWISRRNTGSLRQAIIYLVQRVKAANGVARVLYIHADREKAVTALEQEIVSTLEILLRQAISYKHENNIERQVRTIRNR
jgi:Zinc knuckle